MVTRDHNPPPTLASMPCSSGKQRLTAMPRPPEVDISCSPATDVADADIKREIFGDATLASKTVQEVVMMVEAKEAA